jgi:hypothetical protein
VELRSIIDNILQYLRNPGDSSEQKVNFIQDSQVDILLCIKKHKLPIYINLEHFLTDTNLNDEFQPSRWLVTYRSMQKRPFEN